jgi:pimeloyl-ACP methyl ester carboxylesterase
MGIPKLALVGHGLGAMIAVEFARRHHTRVPRMLISGAPLFDPGDLEERAAIAADLELSNHRKLDMEEPPVPPEATVMSANTAMRTALAQARRSKSPAVSKPAESLPDSVTVARKPLSPKANNNLLFQRLVEEKKITPQKLLDMCFKSNEPEYQKLQVDIPKTDARAVVTSMAAFDAGEMLDVLRRLPMPTVIVHGRNDDLVEAPNDRVLNYLTGDKGETSVLPVLLEGVRHFPMLEHERFYRLLTDFLDTPDVSKLEIKERWTRRSH